MPATPTFDLYLDDLGPRQTDVSQLRRHDGLDAFAFGGFLCKSEEAWSIGQSVEAFRTRYGLTTALHSTEIRGRRKNFAWLKTDPRAADFQDDLASLLCSLPMHCIAAVVDRPGYNARFAEKHGAARWQGLDRSAYPILLERAARFAQANGRRLAGFLEECGKGEDRAIKEHHRRLLAEGQEFNPTTSAKYQPLTAETLSRIALKNPRFIKKSNPLAQVADLVLYPLVKAGYDRSYAPFRALAEAGKLIGHVSQFAAESCDTKYYCFQN